MIGNVLMFLGCVLLIFPTWMLIKLLPTIKDRSASNLFRWFGGKPKEQNPLLAMIRAFQLWGGFWIISGILIKVISKQILDGPGGTLIYAFVFLLPIVLITLVGLMNQRKQV